MAIGDPDAPGNGGTGGGGGPGPGSEDPSEGFSGPGGLADSPSRGGPSVGGGRGGSTSREMAISRQGRRGTKTGKVGPDLFSGLEPTKADRDKAKAAVDAMLSDITDFDWGALNERVNTKMNEVVRNAIVPAMAPALSAITSAVNEALTDRGHVPGTVAGQTFAEDDWGGFHAAIAEHDAERGGPGDPNARPAGPDAATPALPPTDPRAVSQAIIDEFLVLSGAQPEGKVAQKAHASAVVSAQSRRQIRNAASGNLGVY